MTVAEKPEISAPKQVAQNAVPEPQKQPLDPKKEAKKQKLAEKLQKHALSAMLTKRKDKAPMDARPSQPEPHIPRTCPEEGR